MHERIYGYVKDIYILTRKNAMYKIFSIAHLVVPNLWPSVYNNKPLECQSKWCKQHVHMEH